MIDFLKNGKFPSKEELKTITNGKEISDGDLFDIYDIIAMAQNMKKNDPEWYKTSPLGIMHDITNGDPDKMEFLLMEFVKEAGLDLNKHVIKK